MAQQAHFARMTKKQLQVKETSQRCSVPSNPYAKLMYYLYCVEAVKCGDFPTYMTSYANYQNLSSAQKSAIVAAARRHDPDEVLCFAEVDQLPDNDSNKFLQLSTRDESLVAFGIRDNGGQGIMGLRRELGDSEDLVKIMAHTKSWARNNYYQPLGQVSGTAASNDELPGALGLLMLLRALNTDD